jgi:hypothetical protein
VTTEDVITNLFYRVDDAWRTVSKHAQAGPAPGEVATLALLFVGRGRHLQDRTDSPHCVGCSASVGLPSLPHDKPWGRHRDAGTSRASRKSRKNKRLA